jgi:geranylgeranyl diphosphate synthase type II
MDDDDMRRGKPSNHRVYGEAMAILAGDGLLNSAAELISEQALALEGDADSLFAHARAAHEIMKRAGASGMIAGQTADVTSEDKEATADLVRFIENHKTADLITAPVRAGMMLAKADAAMLEDFTTYANRLGVAFQILDDILDVEGDDKLLGKTLGKDADQGKCSYVNVHGMEAAKSELHRLTDEAKTAISKYENSKFFAELAESLERRDH